MTPEPRRFPLVIYHARCLDGWCSAWLAGKALGDADLLPASYGKPPPGADLLAGRAVYVLDFSYRSEAMLALADAARFVAVLDHHKTAEAELSGLEHPRLACTFDSAKSGARLTWEYFFGARAPHWLVDYTEDRDLWLWKLPESREVNAALRSWPMTREKWDELALMRPEEFVADGRAILRAQAAMIEEHVRNAREVELAGYGVLAVNATVNPSEIAGRLAEGRPFGVCWRQRGDGLFQYSLRSREGGVDVSEVARLMGGGGHARAAGFEARVDLEGVARLLSADARIPAGLPG